MDACIYACKRPLVGLKNRAVRTCKFIGSGERNLQALYLWIGVERPSAGSEDICSKPGCVEPPPWHWRTARALSRRSIVFQLPRVTPARRLLKATTWKLREPVPCAPLSQRLFPFSRSQGLHPAPAGRSSCFLWPTPGGRERREAISAVNGGKFAIARGFITSEKPAFCKKSCTSRSLTLPTPSLTSSWSLPRKDRSIFGGEASGLFCLDTTHHGAGAAP